MYSDYNNLEKAYSLRNVLILELGSRCNGAGKGSDV